MKKKNIIITAFLSSCALAFLSNQGIAGYGHGDYRCPGCAGAQQGYAGGSDFYGPQGRGMGPQRGQFSPQGGAHSRGPYGYKDGMREPAADENYQESSGWGARPDRRFPARDREQGLFNRWGSDNRKDLPPYGQSDAKKPIDSDKPGAWNDRSMRRPYVDGGSNLNNWSNTRQDDYPSTQRMGNIGPYGFGSGDREGTYVDESGKDWESKMLQTDSVEKFDGVVKSMNRVQYPNGTQVQMILETDRGDLVVILGPASFIDQAKIKFHIGDKVAVKGYRMRANGDVMVMASEVTRDGYTLQLRDDQRQPVWGSGNQSKLPGAYNRSRDSFNRTNGSKTNGSFSKPNGSTLPGRPQTPIQMPKSNGNIRAPY